jgi:YVTN family beta-propeller protein
VAPQTEGIGVANGQVWVGSNAQHTVTVLDGQTLAPVDTLSTPGLPYRVNTGGRWVVVSNPLASTVRVFDAATRAEVATIVIPLDPARAVPGAEGSAGPVGAVVSPDGRTVYVVLQGMNAVAEIDLETRTVVRYFETGASPDGIAFAPRRFR